jgi:hypothetical protein
MKHGFLKHQSAGYYSKKKIKENKKIKVNMQTLVD